MNRPEGISESAWEAAKPKAIEFVDWLGRFTVDADAEHVLTTTIALALQSSVEAEREAAAKICDEAERQCEVERNRHPFGSDMRVSNHAAMTLAIDLANAIRSRKGA